MSQGAITLLKVCSAMLEPFGASLSIQIFYFIYCCNFPWVCKTVTLFSVTLYAHFINKRDARSYSVFFDYLD